MENEKIIYAKDIDDCSNCPLYGNDCSGGWTSGAGGTPIEPPCCSWDDNDEIYDGMCEAAQIRQEELHEKMLKQERSIKAKRAAKTRKQYAHLDEKYAKFKKWLPKSRWSLIITSRRKNNVYMRAIGKRSANYCFDLEREQFCVIRGKVTLFDQNYLNKFENDFKEFYYGVRPTDRDFVKERNEEVANFIGKFFG